MTEEARKRVLHERGSHGSEPLGVSPIGGDTADAVTKATSVIDFMKEATGVDLVAEVGARGKLRPPGTPS